VSIGRRMPAMLFSHSLIQEFDHEDHCISAGCPVRPRWRCGSRQRCMGHQSLLGKLGALRAVIGYATVSVGHNPKPPAATSGAGAFLLHDPLQTKTQTPGWGEPEERETSAQVHRANTGCNRCGKSYIWSGRKMG